MQVKSTLILYIYININIKLHELNIVSSCENNLFVSQGLCYWTRLVVSAAAKTATKQRFVLLSIKFTCKNI